MNQDGGVKPCLYAGAHEEDRRYVPRGLQSWLFPHIHRSVAGIRFIRYFLAFYSPNGNPLQEVLLQAEK